MTNDKSAKPNEDDFREAFRELEDAAREALGAVEEVRQAYGEGSIKLPDGDPMGPLSPDVWMKLDGFLHSATDAHKKLLDLRREVYPQALIGKSVSSQEAVDALKKDVEVYAGESGERSSPGNLMTGVVRAYLELAPKKRPEVIEFISSKIRDLMNASKYGSSQAEMTRAFTSAKRYSYIMDSLKSAERTGA